MGDWCCAADQRGVRSRCWALGRSPILSVFRGDRLFQTSENGPLPMCVCAQRSGGPQTRWSWNIVRVGSPHGRQQGALLSEVPRPPFFESVSCGSSSGGVIKVGASIAPLSPSYRLVAPVLG